MPYRLSSFARIINHPWRILGIILAVIFTVESLIMMLLPMILTDQVDDRIRAFIDATLLTLISAPILWWIIIGPLRRVAITEQMRAETIASNAGDGIFTTDRTGIIQSCNHVASALFGRPAHEIIGTHIRTLIPDILLRPTLLGEPLKFEGVRADGDSFPLALTISPLPLEVGDGFIIIARDLSEMMRAEEERMVAAREKEAMRAQQMTTLAQLATGVAHEIRNPLTSVKMILQANREQLQDSGLPTEDLELVESEIRRIERSVQALLEFARPTASAPKSIEIADVLQKTVSLIDGRATSHGVAIEIDPQHTRGPVYADPDQLHQLFLNLSLNAIDAMPSGGTLSFRLSESDSDVVVEVCDTGTGISADVMKQLFTPFVTTKKNGVGLGLGICRRIAEDQGGQLVGSNQETGGARFMLRLPKERKTMENN